MTVDKAIAARVIARRTEILRQERERPSGELDVREAGREAAVTPHGGAVVRAENLRTEPVVGVAWMVWALAMAVLYWALRRDKVDAIVISIVVLSHWFLDAIVHRPDLPLAPGSDVKIGLGLWNPMLYRCKNSYGTSKKSPIVDITAGDNWFYAGVRGYEPGAGLGVLDVANLAAAVAKDRRH